MFEGNWYGGSGNITCLYCNSTWLKVHIASWECVLPKSHHSITFDDHEHFGSRNIMFLIFHLTKVSKISPDESKERYYESKMTKSNNGHISRLSNGDTFWKCINESIYQYISIYQILDKSRKWLSSLSFSESFSILLNQIWLTEIPVTMSRIKVHILNNL